MHFLYKEIPDYLLEKPNIIRWIFFTAVFALVFINIYAPFGVSGWFDYELGEAELFFYSSLIILLGVLVVVVSRLLMYHYRAIKISYLTYAVWIAAEIAFMALAYTLIEIFILNDPRHFLDAYKVSLTNTSLVILIPYCILWLYMSYIDKKDKLEEIKQQGSFDSLSFDMIGIKNEKGELIISLKQKDLLYIEAADNYVNIHFNSSKQSIKKIIIRNSLKRLEEELKDYGIIRCHRSYMVNTFIVKLMKKEKDGLHLMLDHPSDIDLPVSRSYAETVMNEFYRHMQ